MNGKEKMSSAKDDSFNTSSNQEEDNDEDEDAEFNGEGEYEEENDDEEDEEENLIDDMLEKPIDILDEKDQVNFYTYNKLQIKSKNLIFH